MLTSCVLIPLPIEPAKPSENVICQVLMTWLTERQSFSLGQLKAIALIYFKDV